MKINKRDPRHWLILFRQGLYTLFAVCGRYLGSKPEKPVVVLYGHQLSGNLKALHEEWKRNFTRELDCYFLTLDPGYHQILQAAGVNVLHCGKLTDMLLVGRCSAIITDHGLHAMRPLLGMTNIRFIDVWHGIPFKGFIPSDFLTQQRYDEIWVSSPLLQAIYVNDYGFEPDRVINMGYARADKLFRRAPPESSYRKQSSIPSGNKLVLYAPTWQQDHAGHELFPFGESQDSFISQLSEVCIAHAATLVVRSHLNAHISEQDYANVLYCSMKDFPDTENLLQETDVLICDWSSIAFDYLALDRPAIFLDVKSPYKNGLSLGKEYRFGEVVSNMEQLTGELQNILQDSSNYYQQHSAAHRDITSRVYGENNDGATAKRQLIRLVALCKT
jgi:CDP-glycerol glycerophosphotransferase